jgi:tetratricopeptide (TPR) repeat protein
VVIGGVHLARTGPLGFARGAVEAREFDSALAWLETAANWGGDEAEIEYLRARCHRQNGDAERFQAALVRAAKLGFPKDRLEKEQWLFLAQTGRMDLVESRIPELLETAGDDAPSVCEAVVNGLLLNFRHGEAFTVVDSWARDYPADPLPEEIRARILFSVNRSADAEVAFRKALEIQPSSASTKLRLAELLIATRRPRDALPLLAGLDRIPATRSQALLRSAQCRRMLGEPDQAAALLDGISSDNQLSEGELLFERGSIALDTGRATEAEELLRKALDANPRSVDRRTAWVRALRLAGRMDELSKESRKLAEIQRKLTEARHLEDRLTTDPADTELRYRIGALYLEFGDPELGVGWLNSVLFRDPNHLASLRALIAHHESDSRAGASRSAIAAALRERLRKAEGAAPADAAPSKSR